MSSMAAYNPATPEINCSDTGIEAKQASPRAIGINTDLPLDTKNDTGILTNNIPAVASKKDTASSVTNTDSDHPDVDDEIRQRNAIPPINSGIDDAKCVDSVAIGEKKENTEGTPTVGKAGVNLTELGQEDTEAANNPSINTDAPTPTDGGISIAAQNKDHSNGSSVRSDAENADTENEENNDEKTPTLNKYGTNMTKLAQEGKLIPFYGREELVDRVIQILCRKTKCNPCLIGHPGLWKTTIVEGLAQRIQSNNVPERLKGKKLLSITSEPESETYCSRELGEDIIEEIKKSNDTLVYFDEGHTIYSRADLKKALAKGDIQCIGAVDTVDEYTESSSLTGVFEKLEVPKPSMDDTLKVLKGLQNSYETHHKVHYTDEAFGAALKLASRYLSDGTLLDTAIDLIDEAGSRVQLLEAKTAETYHKVDDTPILVTKKDVQHVVSFRTGIPVHEVSKEDSMVRFDMGEYMENENEDKNEERTPTLDKYGTNMTKLAQEGKLIPFYGREELVDRVIQILCRKTNCNPCLIGHPGLWKTTIVEGLAQRIQSNNVPERLKGKKLLSITSVPESETYCSKELGEDIIEEIKKGNDTLVYFDEGHTIYSRADLKKALAKGDIQCIGAVDIVDEYTESSSLTGVFEKMEVPEPSMDDILKVLKGLRKSYEAHHKVHYTDEAFDAALKLASRYLSDGILLDTAIDLIDEAGSRVQLLEAKTAETYHKVDDTPISVTKEDVQHVVSFRTGIPVHEVSKEDSMVRFDMDEYMENENEEKNEERTPTLDKYGTNMTKLAQEGKFIPFDGREELVDRVIQILCRKTKCNPCLIGHPAAWKTAIIEGLAQRIQSNNVPERLKGKKLLSITSEPESETYCSKYKGGDIIEEIKKSNDSLVFLDEGHTRYSSFDLEQALAKGDIQCIGAVNTVDEYTESSSLTRVFEKLEVPEPSVDYTLKVLKGLRKSYETHHKFHYTDDAFDAALKLASRYLSDGVLLDTAIDLIDEAGSRVQLLEAKTAETYHKVNDTPISVTKEDVQHVVSFRTGIPVHEVSKEESERLLKLEETLHESIIGQHEALVAIANAIRRSRVGLKSPKRPIASFIFTGPTGVGKTEVAKALARKYFGSEDSMVRFDMSEYMEKHEVAKLIGSPPGYVRSNEGGLLTEAVKRKPHTVVLFDEIEKAHPNIMDIMLQILEDGRLTDNKGVTIKFSHTIIIMTSNIGGNVIHSESTSGVPDDNIYKLVMKEIKKSFRAEFLNRFDEIIVFKQLTKGEVNQIADLMFKEVGDRLKAKDINLNVSDRFRKKVVHDGYSPSHGARQLRRVITTLLENLLAAKLLSKEIKDGDSVVVDVDSEGNIEVLKEPSSLLGE